MLKKTGDVRSEIRALRTELHQLDRYPNYGGSGDGSPNCRADRRPQSQRLHPPQRYTSQRPVRHMHHRAMRQKAIRRRQQLILWVTAGCCASGLFITQLWLNQDRSTVSQVWAGMEEHQGRSPINAQIASPIDVAQLNSLSSIPAPPEKIVQAVQFYLEAGLTPTATAYLVGSLSWESGLDPHIVGDQGHSKGINQWWTNRRRGLPDNFEGQLFYVLHDMQHDALSSGTLTTLQTSHDRAEIKAALKRWTRWSEEGDRWAYAEIILAAMNHDPSNVGS